jgi:L-threonylcarbamoyladenylate synthase
VGAAGGERGGAGGGPGGVVAADAAAIARAAEVLRRGGLVAFPTETVYGLGAAARDPAAVRRIFAAKGRPADHPVIVHLPDAAHLARWAKEVPEAALRLAARFWPGPLTLILPRAGGVPDEVTGGQPTVGLRVPDHPVARALLAAFGDGIAAPSANRFGRVSPTRAEHVREELGAAVDLVLDGGPCAVGVESTIVDLSGEAPALLRPGGVSREALEAALRRPLPLRAASPVRAPGTLEAHYAPGTPLRLVLPETLDAELIRMGDMRMRVAVLARRPAPAALTLARTPRRVPSDGPEWPVWRALPPDAEGYARGLYAALRDLDALGASAILIEAVPEGPEWLAVRDRLSRAARGAPGAGPLVEDEDVEST